MGDKGDFGKSLQLGSHCRNQSARTVDWHFTTADAVDLSDFYRQLFLWTYWCWEVVTPIVWNIPSRIDKRSFSIDCAYRQTSHRWQHHRGTRAVPSQPGMTIWQQWKFTPSVRATNDEQTDGDCPCRWCPQLLVRDHELDPHCLSEKLLLYLGWFHRHAGFRMCGVLLMKLKYFGTC